MLRLEMSRLAATTVSALVFSGVVTAAPICTLAALQGLAPDGTRIEMAVSMASSQSTPAHCLVEGTMRTQNNELRFRLGLPLHWNGKFLFEGVGGMVGILVPVEGGMPRGYAVATTDTGHRGNGVSDPTWALNALQKKIDWGYRAVHVATVGTKALVHKHYGKPIERSYFRGCSNGGRQALTEVQRYPEDYDGVISGAPALNAMATLLAWTWNTQALAAKPEAALSPSDWTLLGRIVRAQCDAEDGLADGVVEASQRCEVPQAKLLCKGPKNDRCLSSAQLEAIDKIWHKPQLSSGEQLLAEGRGYEDDPRVWNWYASAHPAGAQGFLRYMFLDDLQADPLKFDVLREGPALIQRWTGVFDANNPDIAAYLRRGGKLLLWHGGADPALAPAGTTNYFWRARSVTQQRGISAASFDQAVRAYVVPGMSHCDVDLGIDQGELLDVLDRWADHGETPDVLKIRLHGMDGSPMLGRPLCPYPQLARPTNSGSASDAGGYGCVAP